MCDVVQCVCGSPALVGLAGLGQSMLLISVMRGPMASVL